MDSIMSSLIDLMKSAADRQTQLMEGYNKIQNKMNRETLRRKLETAQVSDEEISFFKTKCEAMDEMMNLFESHLSPATADDGENPVLRKGGFTETLEEVLKETEKTRMERKNMILANNPRSSKDTNDVKMVGGKSSVLGSFEAMDSSTSSLIDMMKSPADRQTQLMEGYNKIMNKMSRENLRRKLETAQVSADEISFFKTKCEAMDEMMNLVEKHLSPATADDGENRVLRKGGFTETIEEVLKETEKTRMERKHMILAKNPSSSKNTNDVKMVGGKSWVVLVIGVFVGLFLCYLVKL